MFHVFCAFSGVKIEQGKTGRLESSLRECRESQSSSLGALDVPRSLRMAGFWMQQVRFLVRAVGPDFRQNCTSQPDFGNNSGNFGGNFELPEARAGVELGLRRSQEVRRSPELQRWPESSGRGLDNDFLIEAFSCHVWSFSVLLGRLLLAPGASSCAQGGPWRSGEG